MTGHYISLWLCVRACVCEHREHYEYEMCCTVMMTQLWFFKTLWCLSVREKDMQTRPRFHRPAPTSQPSKEIWAQRFLPVASHRNPPPPTSLFIYFHICVPSPTQAISVTGNLFPPASSFSSNSLIIVLFKKLINVGELMQDHEREAKHRARLQTFRSWLRQGQLFISCSYIRRFMSPTPTFAHLLLAIFL